MIEANTNTRTRDAYRAAHEARGEAMKEFWAWLTHAKPSH